MKNIKLTFAVMLLLGVAACKKNGSNLPPAGIKGNMTTNDAASMVASSLSPTTNGIASSIADGIKDASLMFSGHVNCGDTKSDTISRSNTMDSVMYSFHLTYNFMVDCTNNVPDSLSSNLTWSGSFSGPNWSNSNSGSSIFGIGGLLGTDTAYVVNGQFKRTGTFASKTDTAKHGNSIINITVSNLIVQKHDRDIEGGTATFTITGDQPKKGSFGFTGTITFNANGTATVTVNGTVYTVNLRDNDWHRHDDGEDGHGD